MLRRLIRHPRSQAALARLLGRYLALVARTTRWTLIGLENIEAALGGPAAAAPPAGGAPRRTAVLAFWHERLALMALAWSEVGRGLPVVGGAAMHVLVSRHRDGRLIGEVGARFGLTMVHASSSRGGGVGLLTLARLLGQGAHVAITPDGPRGPRRQAAPGVAHLAALSGRPVLPCAAATSRFRLLGSWDRMLLPLPFGRGVIVVQPPVAVPRRGGEGALPAIQAALTEACDRADALAAAGPRAQAASALGTAAA